MEFCADSRRMGAGHSQAETTFAEMANGSAFAGRNSPATTRKVEAGVSPSSGRSAPSTSLTRGSPGRRCCQGCQVAGCVTDVGARRYRSRQLCSSNVPNGASQALPSGFSEPRMGTLNVRRSWPKPRNGWCASEQQRISRWKTPW